MPEPSLKLTPLWTTEDPIWPDMPKDTHTAFRGSFYVSAPIDIDIHAIGASWFSIWLDGEYLGDGPARFPKTHPEYDTFHVSLNDGIHIVAVVVHFAGISTRLLENMPPFLALSICAGIELLPIAWKCKRLEGYWTGKRRTIETLGWAEFCDTRQLPAGWMSVAFDDSSWLNPELTKLDLGVFRALSSGSVRNTKIDLIPVASGLTSEQFGYEYDDPPARFLFRDLEPDAALADGVWRRYDLGRVRLGKPRFVLDLPEGAVVEFGYCELMRLGRVAPYQSLGGSSCYMDKFIARGGVQEFIPLEPKGLRYLEVHVRAEPSSIKFLEESFLDRGYHGEPEGSFQCDDALLNRIWTMGVDTYRACAEDAILDCPTRERGQWTGDIVNGEMQVAACAYSDLRLVRRALQQSAWCAREDGMVAGLTPSEPGYLTTYAAQWITGVYWYFQQTGDVHLLEEMIPYAKANVAAFVRNSGPEGFKNGLGWGFVDWGYKPNDGPVDIAVNLILLGSIRSYRLWLTVLGEQAPDDVVELETTLLDTSRGYLASKNWQEIGYHRSVLAMREGLVYAEDTNECIVAIKEHILNCFPNNPAAPRLSDPSVQSTQLITPYFANFAMPVLIENGEFDFVLDQYRTCWGWALDQGLTTTPEVFDLRWSHCHAWSAAPTWQLTKYALGLAPAFDEGADCYRFSWHPSSISSASGLLPSPSGSPVQVRWERNGDTVRYSIKCARPMTILDGPCAGSVDGSAEWSIEV